MYKVLSIDPGAKRMGWAVLSLDQDKLKIHGYGVEGVIRGENEPYQVYRLRLIDFWVEEGANICRVYEPDVMVSEIIPVVSNSGFVVATQSQLASTAGTAFQAIARSLGVPLVQISAQKVKRNIGGIKNASKVKVRNGIIQLYPETKQYEVEWRHHVDLTDAIAIGICHLRENAN